MGVCCHLLIFNDKISDFLTSFLLNLVFFMPPGSGSDPDYQSGSRDPIESGSETLIVTVGRRHCFRYLQNDIIR